MSPHLISFFVGLLSLSAETLWARAYAFATAASPLGLATVLAVYLLGIAWGAAQGGEACRSSTRLRDVAAASILAGSAAVACAPFVIGLLPRFPVLLLPLIGAPAFLFSICFPICHHLGTSPGGGKVGASLSRVYAANILGSVIGPLATNFVVLDVATTQVAFFVVGAAGLALAAAMALADSRDGRLRRAAGAAATLGVVTALGAGLAQARGSEVGHFLIGRLSTAPGEIRHVVETRQGVIVATRDGMAGDAIYGGNAYDGRANVDARANTNGINRVVVLQALAPAPRRVLMIGLSVGSWQHFINGFPGVEKVDVVEINPGYLDLARRYDDQSAAVSDPRVNIVIGDGRKFLRENPDARYDLVVMNTTWHWRMYISLLLSREFLTTVKAHMTPQALIAFNTTESVDAVKTASAVFAHAYRYDNFVIAGGRDWRADLASPQARARLREIAPRGKPLFGAGDEDVLDSFLNPARVQTLAEMEGQAGRAGEVITDRNLITEYRYGKR